MEGKKVPLNYEAPFDKYFINLAECTKSYFNCLHFTPNMITTLSLIATLFMYKLFVLKKYKLASLAFLVSYYFDCLDGNYARSYGMVSKFGDYYDHFSDLLTCLLLLYGINQSNIGFENKKKIYLILLVFIIGAGIQLGCIQKIYKNKKESPSLNLLINMCPDNFKIKFWRYFGPGTLVFVMFLIIYNFNKFKNK
ncbi:CDP-alcohol phosphatidyltransferase [seawater metagenome]|uniref:CDP-alcohol phosphatidyltransferase n=1 Tax=seawater metagenome TaxID=1561972 RepID=A0A5E8CK00_9ZZZZ